MVEMLAAQVQAKNNWLQSHLRWMTLRSSLPNKEVRLAKL